MKSFRYFTEYVNASTPAFAVGGASTGPGMGQYSPVADLNAQKKKQRRVKQDPDIKDSPGTEPAKYYAKDASGKGMAKSTKQARDRHFTKGAAKEDDEPSAYKPAPGDKGAKTKLSKYTKKYRKMYGEDAEDDELARDMAAAQRKMQGAREKKRLKDRHKIQMDRLKSATPDEKKALKTRQDAESKANAIAIKRDIENIRRTEGLWDNIRKKRERIKRGSGEKMRKPGEKGAPTPAQIKRAQEDKHGFDCPDGYKFDSKLMVCVPKKTRFKDIYTRTYFFPTKSDTPAQDQSQNQNGQSGNGNGNGQNGNTGNGTGGNGNAGNGGNGGNAGGESYLVADVRKMSGGGYGVYADKFVKGKRVTLPSGKHAKELKKVYKSKEKANKYMAAIMIGKGG